MAHAFYFAGDVEAGVTDAEAYLASHHGITTSPDVLTLRYGLFSVDDARKIGELAHRAPVHGSEKGIIIAAERIFHEAQNALLKVFEEPPAGTTLILVVPTEGVIIPTLRSRLSKLPSQGSKRVENIGDEFVQATPAARAKLVAKVVALAKHDTQEEKQQARAESVRIVEALLRAVAKERGKGSLAHSALASDLERFLPILHERSAALKPILEHLLIAVPAGLGRG